MNDLKEFYRILDNLDRYGLYTQAIERILLISIIALTERLNKIEEKLELNTKKENEF